MFLRVHPVQSVASPGRVLARGFEHDGTITAFGVPMADERTEIAVDAAVKTLRENAREKRQFTWENSSEEWRADLRNFVRPIVEAAPEASDEFLAAAPIKPKPPTDVR
jgi:hypothetical protein